MAQLHPDRTQFITELISALPSAENRRREEVIISSLTGDQALGEQATLEKFIRDRRSLSPEMDILKRGQVRWRLAGCPDLSV